MITQDSSPDWISKGTTYLLPKSENTRKPKNYRPINCLAKVCKLLSSIVTGRTYTWRSTTAPYRTERWKGGSYGCKDQQLINKMILENCKNRIDILNWIDYKRAFDNVPDTCIIKLMEMFKLSPMLIHFMRISMEQWQTIIILNVPSPIITNVIKINSGISVVDTFTPLIFCVALATLSSILNKTKKGYSLYGEKISNLFYIHYLRSYAQNDDDLEEMLRKV